MSSDTKRLEVFQDLYLRGPDTNRSMLRKALLDYTAAPWRHAMEREKNLPTRAGDHADVLAFERESGQDLAAATLWLRSGPDGYRISNIVPLETGKLIYGEYNAVLQDFARRIAAPAARKAGFCIETTSARQSIEDWLSPTAAAALQRFSRTANKSTGSAHPFDQERWFEFIIQTHRDGRQIDTEQLARWLIEIERWDEHQAHELVLEYEFGLALLNQYDRHSG